MSPASIHADAAEIIKEARRLAPGLNAPDCPEIAGKSMAWTSRPPAFMLRVLQSVPL
jgi:hypothetical protein